MNVTLGMSRPAAWMTERLGSADVPLAVFEPHPATERLAAARSAGARIA